MNRLYTIVLVLLIYLDSYVTTIIGEENNPIILYHMSRTGLSLDELMVYRAIVLTPMALFVGWYGKAGITVLLYIILYIIGVVLQFV